jgi:hypothetical protein
MPFEEFEKPPILPEEEEEVEEKEKLGLKEFSEEEIKKIADIPDLEKLPTDTLEKINIENIDTILDLAGEKIAKERQEENKKAFKNLEEGMEDLSDRSSAHHKLLCAVSGKEDFKTFRDILGKFVEEKKIKETDERSLYLREIADRQIKICGIEEELFKIDVKRRIGDLKNDDSFFQKSTSQIENLAPKITEILDYFSQEEIQSKSKEIRDRREKIKENLNLIKDKKFELIKDKFYDFCLNISQLRRIDFEDLEEKKMKETVKSLVESYGG